MTKLSGALWLLALAGCATDNHTATQECLQTAGCVSSFPGTGYDPIHAQAVEGSPSPSRIQPQN